MPLIIVIGCISTGHDSCPPVPSIEGTGLVDVEGIPVTLVGHHYDVHSCPTHSPHSGAVSEGSTLVDVEGIPVAREGNIIGRDGCPSSHLCANGNPLVDIQI